MPRTRFWAAVAAVVGGGVVMADDSGVLPATWKPRTFVTSGRSPAGKYTVVPLTQQLCPPATPLPPGSMLPPGTLPPSTMPPSTTPPGTLPPSTTPPGTTPPGTTPPPSPSPDPNSLLDSANLNAQATERGGQPVAAFSENMFGDLLGISANVSVIPLPGGGFAPGGGFIPGGVLFPNPGAGNGQGGNPAVVRAPVTTRFNGLKVSDNESPAPRDRVFATYNYFYAVNNSLQPVGFPRTNFQRELIGFEKTFFGGDASIGVRLPFVQLYGDPTIDSRKVGDLSVILKFAWINDPKGNVFSSGVVVTAPTGGLDPVFINGVNGGPHSTLIQPFVGFLRSRNKVYVQGFSSLIVPTDSDDTMLFVNSLGAGYSLYKNEKARWLKSITPTIEFHVNTPLNNRSQNDLLFVQDQVNITFGSYFRFNRVTAGTGLAIPTVGPTPFQLEAIANLNYWF